MNLLSDGLAKLSDKLKPLNLYNDSVYGHQTWQGGDLPWVDPT